MIQKPNKRLVDLRSQAQLKDGELYVGGFMARSNIKLMWQLLIGPLAGFAIKHYQIMITNRRVFFGRLSRFGKIIHIDQFEFNEIESSSLKKGLLSYRLVFKFKNGRSLTLDANHKGRNAMEGILFDEKLLQDVMAEIA